MTINSSDWSDTLIHLLAQASQLEDEGQYNLAKLARATADSLSRRMASPFPVPKDKEALAADIQQTVVTLSNLGYNEDVLFALRKGAEVMAAGGVPRFNLIPHPHVCRTCGHLLLGYPVENCPVCTARPETYQRFMPNFWFDALDPQDAVTQFQRTPIEIEKLLKGLTEDQLAQFPDDGGWAIHNVLQHLSDAHNLLDFRLDQFSIDVHPEMESKAVFDWATRDEDDPPSSLEIFEVYKESRNKLLARLELMPIEDWQRTGFHNEFGIVSIQQQVSYFATHEITHLPQIQRLREQFS